MSNGETIPEEYRQPAEQEDNGRIKKPLRPVITEKPKYHPHLVDVPDLPPVEQGD